VFCIPETQITHTKMAFKDPPDPLELSTFRFSALRKVILLIIKLFSYHSTTITSL